MRAAGLLIAAWLAGDQADQACVYLISILHASLVLDAVSYLNKRVT